ncbi:PTS transporter subunit EIIA [Epidermidibacterium keratini]|uniref:Ascorbate-specific PTS system EIIA component n=1 Tax=Epidermidibacterium keratini TaxID=1891644 RepID=A0A7L4YPZ8_9ACTN|nr:PTS sugar transporter subunit IIA [Epidermidibacterium keratini]QHC01200.1 PTS transporter subunit EIIA [Epidermidibacterium keratini]
MSELADLLSEDAIALDLEVDDWQGAVRAAGALLEKTGVADAPYTQSMIDNVVDNGPYIVIAPGFAFAHARPSEAVHRTGLSWVRLATPVEFGHKRNDPVTLVVALAAKDDKAHTRSMAELAKVLANKQIKQRLDTATTPAQVLKALNSVDEKPAKAAAASTPEPARAADADDAASAASPDDKKSTGKILTVCGNGLGTSLFLKNTLEQVLDRWKWSQYVDVEATDTISARGKAKDVDAILTSGEIARTLGEVGIPVKVIDDFTNTDEVDAAMRDLYDV